MQYVLMVFESDTAFRDRTGEKKDAYWGAWMVGWARRNGDVCASDRLSRYSSNTIPSSGVT